MIVSLLDLSWAMGELPFFSYKEESKSAGAGMGSDNGTYIGDAVSCGIVAGLQKIHEFLYILQAIAVRDEYSSVFMRCTAYTF